VFHNTAQAVCEEVLHLTVQEEVVEVLKETMEEVQLVETSESSESSVVVMDRYITEFIESSLAVFIKEQMEAEYVQFAESKCNLFRE